MILKAELPGVNQDDVELRIDDDRITLQGERQLADTMSGKQFLRMERSNGAFHRTFDLPTPVEAEEVKAGILTVTIPKVVSEKSRQIPISG